MKTINNLLIKESPTGIKKDEIENNNSIKTEINSSLIDIAPIDTRYKIMYR